MDWKKIWLDAKYNFISHGIAMAALFVIALVIVAIFVPKTKEERVSRDYQLDLGPDSVKIYDGSRLIGVVPWTDGKIDSVILHDNQ